MELLVNSNLPQKLRRVAVLGALVEDFEGDVLLSGSRFEGFDMKFLLCRVGSLLWQNEPSCLVDMSLGTFSESLNCLEGSLWLHYKALKGNLSRWGTGGLATFF